MALWWDFDIRRTTDGKYTLMRRSLDSGKAVEEGIWVDIATFNELEPACHVLALIKGDKVSSPLES